jgi:glycerophosphoryl diester phosphodiesterase
LIAHRGASGYRPENTEAAFRYARRMGARAAEFDVQQTKDGALVVAHDTDLRRTAGLRRALGAMTVAELRRVDVGSWFSPKYAAERVPTLERVLRLVGSGEVHLEIKQARRPYRGIEERVLSLLNSRPAWKRNTIISSFHYGTLRRLRTLDPNVRLGWLAGYRSAAAEVAKAKSVGAESVHISVRQASAAWVRAAGRAGLKVLVYTVNSESELARLRALGVAGVFTNYPDLNRRGKA